MIAVQLLLSLGTSEPGAVAPDAIPTVDPAVWSTPGAAIPDLELPPIDGGAPVSLASFRGKKVLLIQFASW